MSKTFIQLLTGDSRSIPLKDETVDCVITSPPYWGLRNYGLEPLIWDGDEECEHEWGDYLKPHRIFAFCKKCDAWKGSLGLEPHPDLYVKHIVQIFKEVKRVLKNTGTLWLNLGDSYVGGGRAGKEGKATTGIEAESKDRTYGPPTGKVEGLKPRDLAGMPWRVSFALQADGWYWRSVIPWIKKNPMPESTDTRPTVAIEYILLFSKKVKYFYDAEAVKKDSKDAESYIGRHKRNAPLMSKFDPTHCNISSKDGVQTSTGKAYPKRLRKNSDWFFESWQGLLTDEEEPLALVVNTSSGGRGEKHFAKFPLKLVEPMLKAGCSEKGCCPKCGNPWERILEKTSSTMNIRVRDVKTGKSKHPFFLVASQKEVDNYGEEKMGETKTIGWKPTCECGLKDVKPSVVFDPFVGSGTTLKVARNALYYSAIGMDLSYQGLAKKKSKKMGLLY